MTTDADAGDSAGWRRLTEAQAAVDAIDRSIYTETDRLSRALADAGIEYRFTGRPDEGRVVLAAGIEIERAAADPVVRIIESCGYERLAPNSKGAWRAFRACRSGCTLRKTEDAPFRVQLRWGKFSNGDGRLSRRLAPGIADLEAVKLPEWLWFLYWLVRVVRLLQRKLGGQQNPPNLGPYLETPDALIGPLLDVARVGADDLVVDLGCGDGRILVEAVLRTGCQARGFEMDGNLVERARALALSAGVADRVRLEQADAATARLADADVVFAFLPVATIRELLPSILDQLRPGARLVVHEQERLAPPVPADACIPLLSAEGISVAHRWDR